MGATPPAVHGAILKKGEVDLERARPGSFEPPFPGYPS